MKELFIAWLLSLMTAAAPVNRPQFIPEARETAAEATARYTEIATAIMTAAYDPAVKPLFNGPNGRKHTAALVTTIWWFESGFRKDVDLGTSRERLAKDGLNDSGRSWCMGQINLGKKTVDGHLTSAINTPQGWSGPEIQTDRVKCAMATIAALRNSCPGPIQERLTGYACGRCSVDANASEEERARQEGVVAKGKELSRSRMNVFARWLGRNAPAQPDGTLLRELHP